MIIKNKFNKVFGPVASSSGLFILIAGLLIIYFSLTGIALLLIGALLYFTSATTCIDTENKRLKHTTNLFGLISLGKWLSITPDMKIKIKKSNIIWTSYSRGNRPLEISDKDLRLIIYDTNGKEIMPIQKVDNWESANLILTELNDKLQLKSN